MSLSDIVENISWHLATSELSSQPAASPFDVRTCGSPRHASENAQVSEQLENGFVVFADASSCCSGAAFLGEVDGELE